MAKLVGPALSLDASKSMKKTLTFQRTKTGNKVYKWTKPGGRAPFLVSSAQLAQRALYQAAVLAWNALSSTQKAAYNATAKAIGYLGTGYNYFLRQQILAPSGPPVYDEDDMLKLATVTGIDLRQTGVTFIYTVPDGKNLIVDGIFIRVTDYDITNYTINPEVNVGWNPSDYDDLAEGEWIIPGVESFAFIQRLPPVSDFGEIVLPGFQIAIKVITGTDADVCLVAADLWGYLVDV